MYISMVFPFLGFICSRRFQSCSESGLGVWEVALPAFRYQKAGSSACWAGAAWQPPLGPAWVPALLLRRFLLSALGRRCYSHCSNRKVSFLPEMMCCEHSSPVMSYKEKRKMWNKRGEPWGIQQGWVVEDCRVSTGNADGSMWGKTAAEGKQSSFHKGLSFSGPSTLISKNVLTICATLIVRNNQL